MFYLFIQTWFWVLLAFILGLLIGWYLCCRCKCNKKETVTHSNVTADATVNTTVASSSVAASAAVAAPVAAAVETSDVDVSDDKWKPQGFTSAPQDTDELKRIKGIGPVIEKTLNGLGIFQFKQIAEFSTDNINWVENYLSFPGRIEREEWVSQAKDLAAGKETEFSKRVDKGEMDY